MERSDAYAPRALVDHHHLSLTLAVCSKPLMSSGENASTVDARAVNRARFELELEFVQSLANPFYLHSLAQQNILEQPAFINYLEYLQYWREKDYARFLQFVYNVLEITPLDAVLQAIPMLFIISSCFSIPSLGLR